MHTLDFGSRLAARVLPRVWSRLPTRERVLYLTFDDGPSEATPEVLDVLDASNARASFFVQGEALEARTATVQRIVDAGHAVGSHGWHHADPWKTWQPSQWRLGDEAVWRVVGKAPRWQRPPYGHLTFGLWRHAHRMHQHVALWDVMPGDFRPDASPLALTDVVLRRVRSGSIVVLHDGGSMHGRIGPLVERLVPMLLGEGWRLAALPDDPRGDQPGGTG